MDEQITRKFIHDIMNDITKLDIRIKILKEVLSKKQNLTDTEKEMEKHISILNTNIDQICSKSLDWKKKL